MTPIHGRLKRLMARQGRGASTGKQSESIAEARGDLVEGDGPQPRRGKLDREWHAIEAAANLTDGGRVRRNQAEPIAGVAGTLGKESRGLRLDQLRYSPGPLAADAELHSTGDEDVQAERNLQEGFDHAGDVRG